MNCIILKPSSMADQSSEWQLWEGAQAAEHSATGHPFPKLQTGGQDHCGYLLRISGISRGIVPRLAPCLDTQDVHHQSPHEHPFSIFVEAAAGKNTQESWSWLPVLLVDYSHLFPSGIKCANQGNISQWLVCYNPPLLANLLKTRTNFTGKWSRNLGSVFKLILSSSFLLRWINGGMILHE